ncbi:MAG: hypothetical protein NTW96_24790 [Planctomycetia bacterium]|nr:hypothetical protein [Planctomycetia bacterium]
MESKVVLTILGQIAASFPQESQEAEAIKVASLAVLYANVQETRTLFERFIREKDRPLNGLELIQLRLYGLDIPDNARSPEILALSSEIDKLAEKLSKFRD